MKSLFKSVVFSCLFIATIAFAISMPLTSFAQEAQVSGPSNDFYAQPDQEKLWKILRVGKEGVLMVDGGDIVVSKDTPSVFKFGNAIIMVAPGTVIRVHEVKAEESKEGTPIPEVLFGEAFFIGEGPETLLLPGHAVQLSGRAILTVDQERYSFVESISGDQVVYPIGLEEEHPVSDGTYLEMSPFGEVGELQPIEEEYLKEYLDVQPEEEAVQLQINKKEEPLQLLPYSQFWTQERVDLLQEGEESPQGLAIANGAHMEEEESGAVENVQAFDQSTIKQKSLTFSASVDVSQAAADVPALTSFSIGGEKAENGGTINLTYKNLEDKNIPITGKAVSSDPAGYWKLIITVGEDEINVDAIDSISTSYKVIQDFANLPTVYDVSIGQQSAEMFQGEYNLVTRDDLSSGKLEIMGSADAGVNQLTYNIEVTAVDKDDNSHSIGKYTVELDLSELSLIEVSIDDGLSWESASGKSSWSYQLRPSDGETYKVKARATDVMENISDEQFESWEFKYSYQTPKEILKEVFEAQMTALSDEDSNTFMRSVTQEYSSNIDGLRDYNELESAVQYRFQTGDINIRYTVSDVSAYLDTKQGTVEFNWTSNSGFSSGSHYEVYYYVYEEGKWLLREITDPNTFILLSKIAYSIEISPSKTTLNADGADESTISVRVLDDAGTIVANDVEVLFTASDGSFSPETALTYEGDASSVYTAGTTAGVVTITVSSGNAVSTADLTLLSRVPDSIVLDIADSTIYAGGDDSTTITATVNDKQGDPVDDGVEVTFAVTDGTISPSSGLTSNGSVTTTYVSGNTEGTVTITAASGDAQTSDTISLLSREPFSIDISTDKSTLNADGADSTTVTVTVYDKQGDPVLDGEQVAFSVTGGSISPTSGLTSNGSVTTTYTAPTTDGTVTITAMSGDAQASTDITIDPLAAPLPPE